MKRSDGVRIPLEPYQQVELSLIRKRTEASILINLDLDITQLLAFLEKQNVSLFSYFIFALNKTVAIHPEMNRFVMHHHLYQHNQFTLSTVIKQNKHQAGNMSLTKLSLKPNMSLNDIHSLLQNIISEVRSVKGGSSDKMLAWMRYLPKSILDMGVSSAAFLDRHNILPSFIIKDDPLHASCIIANLNSIGLKAPNHYLFNWGTSSLFIVMGKIENSRLPITFTMDDRIGEGISFGQALETFSQFLEHPNG